MKENEKYLFAEDVENLQLTPDEYVDLMEKAEEGKHLLKVKNEVLADLRRFLDKDTATEPKPQVADHTEPEPQVADHAEPEPQVADHTEPEPQVADHPEPGPSVVDKAEPEPQVADHAKPEPEFSEAEAPNESSETEAPEAEKVSVESSTEESEPPKQRPVVNARTDISEVPPIKNEITEHFNKFDESGRLFNVFKQYYTCLNEACGGTVRVTMKDGFCSLWNYDEWEEFAFVDIFEGLLRIAIDPRYTDALKSLSLCEAPRLISSRRNVISVQIDDLNNTVLDVLTKAFSEVGMQVG